MAVAVGPLAVDPTRTRVLREQFAREMRVRFARLSRKIVQLVDTEDAFGLRDTPHNPFVNAETITLNTRWRFNSDSDKLKLFQEWLAEQLKAEITTDPGSTVQDWWMKYIKAGFEKGAGRAYDDANKAGLVGDVSDFYAGSKDQFLRTSFANPTTIDKVKLLGSRVFTELKGVTEAMSQSLTRVLTDGITQGKGPREIARLLTVQVDGIGRKRAELIARTELIRAHAEGQLNSLEALGVDELGVMVEWNTTGDGRVCPQCVPLDGIVIKTSEARNLLPRHPGCRCAWIPANLGEDQSKQKRTKPAIDLAIDESIQKEKPKADLEKAKAESKWVGADLDVSKVRPKSILDETPAPKEKPVKRSASVELREKEKAANDRAEAALQDPDYANYLKINNKLERLKREVALLKSKGLEPLPFHLTDIAKLEKDRLDALAKTVPIQNAHAAAIKERDEIRAQLKENLQKTLASKKGDLENVRKQVAAITDEVGKAEKERKDKIKEYNKTAEAAFQEMERDFKSGKITREEWSIRFKENMKRENEYVAWAETELERINGLKATQRARILDAISLPKGERADLVAVNRDPLTTFNSEGKTITTQKVTPEHQAKVDEAVDFLEKISAKKEGGAAYVFNSHVLPSGDRAFYRDTNADAAQTGIYLDVRDRTATFVHEIGHHLEYEGANAQALANEFIENRIEKSKSKDVKLADLFPGHGYSDYEYGNEDGFGKVFSDSSKYYAGKRYGTRGATEVVSMGLELMYEDPGRFARDDPEYFKFILGIVRGTL